MSHAASAWAWKQECPDPGTKLVLVNLASYADDEGVCWPAQKTIADQTGMTRESVCRAVKRLAEIGLISLEHRATPSGRLSNIYRLACQDSPPLSDPASHTLSDPASHSQSDVKSHAKVILRHTQSDATSHKPLREPSKSKLENLPSHLERTESSNRARAPDAKGGKPHPRYAFCGRIIRLTQQDFDGWREAYFTILDLRAKLESLDCYYDGTLMGTDRKKWYYRCSSALDKEHQANLKASTPQITRNGADIIGIAIKQFPQIAEGRIRELAKAAGCREYGPPGEYQCWKFLRGRND